MRVLSPTVVIPDGKTSHEAVSFEQLALKLSTADITSTASNQGASLVGFRQAGAGAVSRSVYDKIKIPLSASDFGVVGNLIYRETSTDTVEIVTGTDCTIQLQAALLQAHTIGAANAQGGYEGHVTLTIERGKYIISDTLVIPPYVELDCQGFLFNFIPDPNKPIVVGKALSHCRQIYVHANGKNGVRWGEAGQDNQSELGRLVIWHVGQALRSQSLPLDQLTGLLLQGRGLSFRSLRIQGGYYGLALTHASEVLGSQLEVTGAASGVAIATCEQIDLASVELKSVKTQGILINDSHHICIKASASVDSDHLGTPMKSGITVGSNSISLSTHLSIEYLAQSTGGWGLEIERAADCSFNLKLSNSRSFRQTSGNRTAVSHWVPVVARSGSGALLAHNLGILYDSDETSSPAAAIKYGELLSGYLDIHLTKSADISTEIGNQYGNLMVVDPTSLLLRNVHIEGVLPGQFVRADSGGKLVGVDPAAICLMCGASGGSGGEAISTRNLVYTQSAPALSATISHDWGIYPHVDVMDPISGDLVWAQVFYDSLSVVRVEFDRAFAGQIILNGGTDIHLSSGEEIVRYQHTTQTDPQAVWLIEHNWETFPLVTVFDSETRAQVYAEIYYPNPRQVEVRFDSAYVGEVALNAGANVSLPIGVTFNYAIEHQEATPLSTWLVPHQWGHYPMAMVVDVSGALVYPQIRHVDRDTVEFSFGIPFAGTAYLHTGSVSTLPGGSDIAQIPVGQFLKVGPGHILEGAEIPNISCCPFTDLPDTAGAYQGQAHKFIRVNESETALEYIDQSPVPARPSAFLVGELKFMPFPLTGDTWIDDYNNLWIIATGCTIGDVISGATIRREDMRRLYGRLWTNPQVLLLSSAGLQASRGISSSADFEAHKRLIVPRILGTNTALLYTGTVQ